MNEDAKKIAKVLVKEFRKLDRKGELARGREGCQGHQQPARGKATHPTGVEPKSHYLGREYTLYKYYLTME